MKKSIVTTFFGTLWIENIDQDKSDYCDYRLTLPQAAFYWKALKFVSIRILLSLSRDYPQLFLSIQRKYRLRNQQTLSRHKWPVCHPKHGSLNFMGAFDITRCRRLRGLDRFYSNGTFTHTNSKVSLPPIAIIRPHVNSILRFFPRKRRRRRFSVATSARRSQSRSPATDPE